MPGSSLGFKGASHLFMGYVLNDCFNMFLLMCITCMWNTFQRMRKREGGNNTEVLSSRPYPASGGAALAPVWPPLLCADSDMHYLLFCTPLFDT